MYHTKQIVDFLNAVILKLEQGWTVNFMARDKLDRSVHPSSSEAVKFCILGAIEAAAVDDKIQAYAYNYIVQFVDQNLLDWNDFEAKNVTEVILAVAMTIICIEEKIIVLQL